MAHILARRSYHPTSAVVEALIDPTVQAAQRGDEQAFASLYDVHATRVYALCLRLAGNHAAAAELVQDVFVRVWQRLSTYKGDSAFTTWLHRVAVNTVLEADRKGRRRSLRVMIDADFRGIALQNDHAPQSQSTTARAATTDTALAIDIEQAIAQLPPGARAVFILHDIEGYQHAEIAEQLGIAEGTCKAHLFRARRLLREVLER